MQPGRGGDPDIEPAPFHRFGQGPGGDLGTDGPCPEIEEAPVGRGMGYVPLLENFSKDLPDHFRF